MNVQATANRLETAADKMGYSVKMKFATTGTIYLYCDAPNETVIVRVADHSDAYGRAHYTCDELEGTYKGAKAFLQRRWNEIEADNEKYWAKNGL